jgi:hypothetical protein
MVGLMLSGVGYLFIGPAPFLIWLHNEIWTNVVGLVLIGSLMPRLFGYFRVTNNSFQDLV